MREGGGGDRQTGGRTDRDFLFKSQKRETDIPRERVTKRETDIPRERVTKKRRTYLEKE